MKYRYLLKRRGPKGGLHPIYLALYEKETTELIFTGQRISLADWNATDRLPKDHRSEISKAIEKVKLEVQRAIRRLEADELPITPFKVKEAFAARQKDKNTSQAQADKKAKGDVITLTKLATRWQDDEIFRFRDSTQKSVKESIKAFTEYLKIEGFPTLERKELTPAIISGYERYLLQKKKLSDNTHGKRMKHLRWFLKSMDYDTKNIKLRSSKKTIVSLTMDELASLEKVDVSDRVEYQKAKDFFLLGCYTGLRISDLKRLNITNTRDGFITLKLLKNNRQVKIPILPSCQEILFKYEYRAPKLSEQTLNECIKKVCAKAKIEDLIEIDTTKAGKRITQMVPKYSMITSHIAGKTFISLAPKKFNLTPEETAAIVGKDVKTLLNHYLRLPHESAIEKMTANTQKTSSDEGV